MFKDSSTITVSWGEVTPTSGAPSFDQKLASGLPDGVWEANRKRNQPIGVVIESGNEGGLEAAGIERKRDVRVDTQCNGSKRFAAYGASEPGCIVGSTFMA